MQDKINIVTLGSCLSAEVANYLEEHDNSYYRVSSVQHNRIDQFMENYIYKIHPALSVEDLNLKVKEKFSYVNVFDNQFEKVSLGRALPFKRKPDTLEHPVKTIEVGNVNLLIIDNYPDMFFKVFSHKDKGTKFFINKGYLEEEPVGLEFVNEFLSPEDAAKCYKDLINFCKQKNENLVTIFINFPVNLKDNKFVSSREQQFVKEMDRIRSELENVFIIEPWTIKVEDLSNPNDPYHFKEEKYAEYALECKKILQSTNN